MEEKQKYKNQLKKKSTSVKVKEKVGLWISKSEKFEKLIDKAAFYFKNPEKLNEVISEAYNKATNESGNKTIAEMWGKLNTLFRMVKAHFHGEYRQLSTGKILLGIAVILYFILPTDLIPDFIPVAGYIDDASLLTWFIRSSVQEINKFNQWEAKELQTISPPL